MLEQKVPAPWIKICYMQRPGRPHLALETPSASNSPTGFGAGACRKVGIQRDACPEVLVGLRGLPGRRLPAEAAQCAPGHGNFRASSRSPPRDLSVSLLTASAKRATPGTQAQNCGPGGEITAGPHLPVTKRAWTICLAALASLTWRPAPTSSQAAWLWASNGSLDCAWVTQSCW